MGRIRRGPVARARRALAPARLGTLECLEHRRRPLPVTNPSRPRSNGATPPAGRRCGWTTLHRAERRRWLVDAGPTRQPASCPRRRGIVSCLAPRVSRRARRATAKLGRSPPARRLPAPDVGDAHRDEERELAGPRSPCPAVVEQRRHAAQPERRSRRSEREVRRPSAGRRLVQGCEHTHGERMYRSVRASPCDQSGGSKSLTRRRCGSQAGRLEAPMGAIPDRPPRGRSQGRTSLPTRSRRPSR